MVVAGSKRPAPALLSRQSVVLGVSDGAIKIARQEPTTAKSAAKPRAVAAPAARLVPPDAATASGALQVSLHCCDS